MYDDDGLGGMTEVYSGRPRAISPEVAEECEEEIAHRNRRRVRMGELETTVRVLKARVQARDIAIAQLKAKVRELQAQQAAEAVNG